MKGKWKVESNTINGERMYAAVRIKDVNAVDHSGNREYGSEYTDNREFVQALCDYMNEAEQ